MITNQTECQECEGTGQRAFAVNCPEYTPCVDCGGTGKIKNSPPLNERLTAAGYTTRPSQTQYKKQILFMGEAIFEGSAHEVSAWLDGKPDSSWEFEDFDDEDDFEPSKD
jgi:DnaJ-class molecular chaperone